MVCSANETSERVVRQVGRGARTGVERRDAGALVVWFVAVAVVDDVASVAAVSVGFVTNEIRAPVWSAVMGRVWFCTVWELGAKAVASVGRAGGGSSGLSGRGVATEGT